MGDGLKIWLSAELENRHWSQRELARQSGVSQALVWQVLSGDVTPSADFCIKVAQALGEAPEKVLRLAGILPPGPASDDSTLQELMELARSLPPGQRKEALRYLRYLYQSGKEK